MTVQPGAAGKGPGQTARTSESTGSVCSACRAPVPPDARFCPECGNRLARPRQDADTASEYRQITVMFADLVGSTELAVSLDAEDLREILSEYQAICADEIESRGGMIQSYAGDGLLAYFGYPRASETAARSGVEAGLAIATELVNFSHPAAEEAGLTVAARIGLHTGRVLVSEMGAGLKRERDAIMGVTPNIAARLEAFAHPNGVVISEQTRQLVSPHFRLDSMGPQHLKGLPEPVEAFHVLATATPRSVFEHAGRALFGRDEEMGTLKAAWAKANAGETTRVSVIAEPGSGKTALAARFLEESEIDDDQVIAIAGDVGNKNSPFAALRQCIEQLFDIRSPILTSAEADANGQATKHLKTLAALVRGEFSDGTEGREAIFNALTALIGWNDQPSVVVLEDAHWIDPSTLEMMDRASAAAPPSRLFLLLSRPVPSERWRRGSDVTIRLGRLEPQSCRALVEARAGCRIEASVLERIEAATHGHPLYVEEYTKALMERGLAQKKRGTLRLLGDAQAVETPSTLLDLITARLDNLGAARELAQVASVLGRRFTGAAIASVRDVAEDAVAHDLRALLVAGIVADDGGDSYVFRHPLFQKAAYESLTRASRRHWHRRFVVWLKTDPERWDELAPETAGYHLEGCGELEDAAFQFMEAGMDANRASASLEAATHFQRSRELFKQAGTAAGDTELRVQVLLAGALLSARGPGAQETRAAYDDALALAEAVPESEWHLAAYWGWWRVSDTFATMAKRANFLLEASKRLKGEEFRLQAMHCAWANSFAMGEIDASIQIAQEGLDLYDSAGFVHQSTLYGGHDCKVCALGEMALSTWLKGAGDAAAELAQQAIAHAEEIRHVGSLMHALDIAVMLHHYRRDGEMVRQIAERLVSLGALHELEEYREKGEIFLAWRDIDAGDVAAGLRRLEAAFATLKEMCTPEDFPVYHCMHAEALCLVGEPDNALKSLAEGRAVIVAQGVAFWAAEIARHEAEAELLKRPAAGERAAKRLQEARETAAHQGALALELRAAVSGLSLAKALGGAGGTDQAAADVRATLARFEPTATGRDIDDAHAALLALNAS